MRTLVLLSGVWNLMLGACIAVPPIATRIGVTTPHFFWNQILLGVLGITGVFLVLASHDLARRATLVYWEGIARICAAILLFTVGRDVIGWGAWLIGATDLLWAIVYLAGLPRAARATHIQLLLDRVPR